MHSLGERKNTVFLGLDDFLHKSLLSEREDMCVYVEKE